MSLTEVQVTTEVWLTCVTHALSTETEEIMGLLLGDVEHLEDGSVTAHIWAAAPQTRSDRRKDRVETNPEQLAAASAEAERLSAATGRTTRVIGWYHSHPHITVLPSHVDVRTQAMYQLLEEGFVGLIFSCFSEDATKTGRIQATAFQSTDTRQRGRSPPTSATQQLWAPPAAPLLAPAKRGPSPGATSASSDEFGPTPSGGMRSGSPRTEEMVPAGSSARSGGAPPAVSYLSAVRGGSAEVDSPTMREAMLRSNLDLSGAEFHRKEVPMRIVSGQAFPSGDFALSPLVTLQRILFMEERAAFHHALSQSDREGRIHPLAAVHHSATYQASLCKLMEYCLAPVISALWDRNQQNQLQLEALKRDAALSQEARRVASSEAERRATSGTDLPSQQRTDPSLASYTLTSGGIRREPLEANPGIRAGEGVGPTVSFDVQGRGLVVSKRTRPAAPSPMPAPLPMPGWPTTSKSEARGVADAPVGGEEKTRRSVESSQKEGGGSFGPGENLINLG